jgi:PAS domain S-box-containing protein
MAIWHRFMDWPLRAKMAALFVVASLLPLGVATWINIREARQRMVTTTEALLAARADQLVQRLDTLHRDYQRSADRLAHLPRVIDFYRASPQDFDQLKSIARTVLNVWPASDTAIRGVALLDMSGTVKVATEDPLIGVDLSYHSYVQKALRGVAVISDVHLAESQVGNAPTIAYLAPVFGPNQKMVGVVAFWVRATAIWDVMKASNELAGRGSFAVMFDHNGIRIAHTYSEEIIFHPGGRVDPAVVNALVAERRFGEKTRQLLEDVRAFPEQFDRALSESPDREVFRGLAPVNQKWNYGVARRFEIVPWTVFYMFPEDALNADIAQMTRQKSLFAGAILLTALLGGTLFAAVILRPIRSLAIATESIAAGDLAARVPASHSDELGRLSKSFNSMAERIEAQDTALQKVRDDLETRVQERTAELEQKTKDLQVKIAEREQAEQSLRKSEAQLQTIVESLGEGVAVSDLKGQLVHFNRAALDLHGYASLDEIRRHMSEFVDTFELSDMAGTVIPPDQWPFARVLRGEKLHNWEVRIRRIQNADWHRIFNYGGTLVHDSNGQPLMAVVTVGDITERRRAAEEIRQLNADLERRVVERTAQLQVANNELEAFCYSVSHDLRAPLRSLDGFSQAVMEDCASTLDAEGLDNLRRIRAASQRMGHLIDDLLNLSRLTRVEITRKTVDLTRIAKEVVEEIRAGEPGRKVNIVIQEGLVAEADPRLLRIVLTNLIGNAWKFTTKRKDAHIEIGCKQEEGKTVFFVQDNGAGFDMAYATKLFGAFQRLHSMEEFPGTGIGLATVQRIVHRHNGSVRAESTLDVGAVFRFTL